MHHFQLKPVRSLDSLRPAWSGHLRHGPPPSNIITNPRKISSVKPILLSSFHPLPVNNLFNQSKVSTFNSITANRIVKEVDKTSLLLTSPTSYNQVVEPLPNRFLRELHIHNDLMRSVINSSSCDHENENVKSEEKFSFNKKFNSKDIFAHTDSTSSTWEPFDRPFKTSNFLNEVNEDDPFDTSKVFMPTYLQTAPFFKSTIPMVPIQFYHPLLHPFNTTSCSAHAKVNIIVHYLLRQ